MPEKCERCEQLELLAQAYQDALKNTFRALMVSLQPDTSDERRAQILRSLSDGPFGPSEPQEASQEPPTAPDAKKS